MMLELSGSASTGGTMEAEIGGLSVTQGTWSDAYLLSS